MFIDWQNNYGKHKLVHHNQDALVISQIDSNYTTTDLYRRLGAEASPIPENALFDQPWMSEKATTLVSEEPEVGITGKVTMVDQPTTYGQVYRGSGRIDDRGRYLDDALYLWILDISFWLPDLDVVSPMAGSFSLDLSKFVSQVISFTSTFPPISRYPSLRVVSEFIGYQSTTGLLPLAFITWEFNFKGSKSIKSGGHIVVSLQRSRYDFMEYLANVTLAPDDMEDELAITEQRSRAPCLRMRRPKFLRALVSRLLNIRR